MSQHHTHKSDQKEMVNDKKKQSESIIQDRKTNNTNGVVITVYEESVIHRSRKSTKPRTHFTRPRAAAAATRGYDRKSQLLVHSRQLRNYAAASQKVPLPTIQSQTKSKKKGFWLTKPLQIWSCSPSRYMPLGLRPFIGSRCRYERVESSKVSKEINRSKNRKASGKAYPIFLSKVKKMLKELSCKDI